MNNKDLMNHAADNIRLLAVSMVEKAKSGHPGGAMGGADFINVLFSEFLVFDPDQPTWEGRDRFYLDPGHMSPMLYSALALQGKYTIDDLKTFRQWGTVCPGHPERDIIHGIENTSGPLGQGHTYAVGAAIAEKFLEARLGSTMMQHKIYAYISDGGVQEEISQGAGRIAGLFKLNNLIMFYDANEIQLSTECDVVMRENTRMKYESWGWNVLEINGNDPDEIRAALILANKEENRPTLIIGHTVMAKGARKEDGSSYERSVKTHGAPLGGGAYENTVKNLGGDLNDPFVVFDDVKELYEKRNAELREIVKECFDAEEEWRKANPEKAEQMKVWFSGDAPKVDWSALVQKRDVATRVASANCLGVLAEQVPNMVCSSADLCNSDKTDGFLKKTHELAPDDFTGAFFQAGVSELTMACMCIGMYLHGGVIPACGTFFVFSDYMTPAIRMAALMRVPIKFIWTHDAFRVGEDGPTHHGAFDLAALRPIPHLTIASPMDEHELRNLMYSAQLPGQGSYVIRYPRGKGVLVDWKNEMEEIKTGTGRKLKDGDDVAVLTLGPIGNDVEKVIAEIETASALSIAHYDMRFLKPLDEALLEEIAKKFDRIITIEDGVRKGGFGSAILEWMSDHGYRPQITRMGIPDEFVEHGTVAQLREIIGLDNESIRKTIENQK